MTTVRRATPRDRPQVERLLRHAGLPLAGVADAFANFFVADAEGVVAGAIGLEWHGPYALLRSAVVDPAWRGRGLGALLTGAALSEARRGGARAVFLLTETAAEFFRRFGFAPVNRANVPEVLRRSVEFTSACPESAIAMKLDLAMDRHPAAGAAVDDVAHGHPGAGGAPAQGAAPQRQAAGSPGQRRGTTDLEAAALRDPSATARPTGPAATGPSHAP
ncbi:MAG TPA: arsenic resistance N-acetyltransferase ArsN2 [Longimicrobiales bacterium]